MEGHSKGRDEAVVSQSLKTPCFPLIRLHLIVQLELFFIKQSQHIFRIPEELELDMSLRTFFLGKH